MFFLGTPNRLLTLLQFKNLIRWSITFYNEAVFISQKIFITHCSKILHFSERENEKVTSKMFQDGSFLTYKLDDDSDKLTKCKFWTG